MARGPEGKIQDHVREYAKSEHDCLSKKMETGFYGRGESKWFDVLFFPDRRRKKKAAIFMIEFKKPGEVPDPAQQYRIDELVLRGYRVHVVSSKVRGKQIVDEECK